MKRQVALISAVFLIALGVRAFGDYTATQGAGTTVFAFVCSAKVCPGSVPMTSAGIEIVPATAAKQPALGTAGAAATDVLTVQGIAAMTPLLVTLSAETTKVIGTVNQGTSPWVSNTTQLGGVAINLGAGATGTGTQRITQASDSPEIAVLGATGAAAGCGTANTVWQCLFQIDNDVKNGTGATGASVPATALYPGLRGQNAEQTAVTNGQLVGSAADLVGKTIVLPYANPENGLNGQITAAMTGTSTTAVTGMGAQGAGVRNYVTQCTFSNSHATVGTMILLQDGSGGTTIWQAPAAPAFGGAVVQFPTPIKTTANTALFAQNVTTGANTFVSCTGYKGI